MNEKFAGFVEQGQAGQNRPHRNNFMPGDELDGGIDNRIGRGVAISGLDGVVSQIGQRIGRGTVGNAIKAKTENIFFAPGTAIDIKVGMRYNIRQRRRRDVINVIGIVADHIVQAEPNSSHRRIPVSGKSFI